MREIKFRAYCPRDKAMFPPWTIFEAIYAQDASTHAEEDILMQYTGLKDKNGEEIYEGDIVLHGDEKGSVIFEEGAFNAPDAGWFVEDLVAYASWSTVIGNLYENPELLK